MKIAKKGSIALAFFLCAKFIVLTDTTLNITNQNNSAIIRVSKYLSSVYLTYIF